MPVSLHYCPTHFAGTTRFQIKESRIPAYQVQNTIRELAEQHQLYVRVLETRKMSSKQQSDYDSAGITHLQTLQPPTETVSFKVKTLTGKPERVKGFESALLDHIKQWLTEGALRQPKFNL